MILKTLLAASVLALAPTFAVASGCAGYDHKQQASISCADGMILDNATGTCVAPTTS